MLAPALWALGVLIDKFLLSKFIKNTFTYVILWIPAALIITISIFILISVSFNPSYLLFGFVLGILNFAILILYMKILSGEETTKAITLLYLGPLFTAVLSAIFLREIFTIPKYFGIALVIGSTVMISYRKLSGKHSLSPVIGLAILVGLASGVGNTLLKHLLNSLNFWSMYFWTEITIVVLSLALLLNGKLRAEVYNIFTKKLKIAIGGFASSSFAILGFLSFFIAVSLGPVSLTHTLNELEPSFVFLYSLLLTPMLPHFVIEDIRKNMLTKILGILAMFIGIALVTLV